MPSKAKPDDYCKACFDICYFLFKYEKSIDEIEECIKNQNIILYNELLGSKVVSTVGDSLKYQKSLSNLESSLRSIDMMYYEVFSLYANPFDLNEFKNVNSLCRDI